MRILVLSPHTDDAELGCGGSIVKFLDNGDTIHWMVFSTAEESLPNGMPKDKLRTEFLNVVQSLNLKPENYTICNLKVRYLHEHRQAILEKLIDIREHFKPDLVIGSSINDYHQDHQVIANEMIRAFKTSCNIISYEQPWNHVTFNTQLFIRLDELCMSKKCALLKNYKSQIMKEKTYFSDEFVYGMAKMRGIQCNSDYAEAFEVVRWMV